MDDSDKKYNSLSDNIVNTRHTSEYQLIMDDSPNLATVPDNNTYREVILRDRDMPNVKCVRNIDNRLAIFTFVIINLLNSTIFCIVNMTKYDTNTFHEYMKLICNIYLIGDNFIQCLYIYKKIKSINNNRINSVIINSVIIGYATITIGYVIFIGISHFESLNVNYKILCLFMGFRYVIYILQLI